MTSSFTVTSSSGPASAKPTSTPPLRGASPQQPVAAAAPPGSNPNAAPYVSPGMLPQPSRGPPPPFSLSAGATDPASLDGTPGQQRPRGTDPTKYKTTICRNWEQSGTCSFRGCAFAHGVDDLRPPTRASGSSGGVSPLLGSSTAPTGPPPMGLGPSSAAAAAGHYFPAAHAPPAYLPPVVGCSSKYEAVIEMLHGEVSRQRDLMLVHCEANRALDGMVKKERDAIAEAAAKLEHLKGLADSLQHAIDAADARLARLGASSGMSTNAPSWESIVGGKRTPGAGSAASTGSPMSMPPSQQGTTILDAAEEEQQATHLKHLLAQLNM